MNHTTIVAGLVALAFTLTGCGVDEDGVPAGGSLHELHRTLEDGRAVTCIMYKGGYAGGLSCDWEGAR